MNIGHLIVAVATLLSAAVGVWVNLNNDITKLKSRLFHMEQQDQENKIIFAKILDKLQHIELLLAENHIKSK
jgi:hypothetical protein|tara:strand:- start:104 stop:319 length:216 start_codon:yes stop_codon:yes gene_type:complete